MAQSEQAAMIGTIREFFRAKPCLFCGERAAQAGAAFRSEFVFTQRGGALWDGNKAVARALGRPLLRSHYAPHLRAFFVETVGVGVVDAVTCWQALKALAQPADSWCEDGPLLHQCCSSAPGRLAAAPAKPVDR